MKPLYKGLLLAALHLAIVLSLGGKLLYDRSTRPRVWAKAAPVDPESLFRGRYVQLGLEVQGQKLFDQDPQKQRWQMNQVELRAEGEQLVAVRTDKNTGNMVRPAPARSTALAILVEPVAYFIPERVPDPSRRAEGEELWVEVTIPKKGPPRPIRLGVKKEGKLTPLELD